MTATDHKKRLGLHGEGRTALKVFKSCDEGIGTKLEEHV